MSQVSIFENVSTSQRYMPVYSLSAGYREVGPATYFLPESKRIVVGETGLFEPDYSNEIMNVKAHYDAKRARMNGNLDQEGAALAGISSEWYEKVKIYNEIWKRGGMVAYQKYAMEPQRVREFSILTGDDFAAIKDTQAQAKIIAATPRRHILLDLVTVQNTDVLEAKIFDWTGYDAINEKIGDLTVPFSGKGKVASQTVTLDKYAWHHAYSEEFSMHRYDVDIGNLHLQNFAGQMETVKNKRVADLLTAFPSATYASWSAMATPPQSTRDPRPDINTELTTLFNTEKGEGSVIVSNRSILNAYENNSYIYGGYPTGTGSPDNVYSYGNAIINNVVGFRGLRWGIDNLIPAASGFMVFDPQALVFLQGPTRLADYEDRQTGVKGTISKDWFAAKTIIAELTRRGAAVA